MLGRGKARSWTSEFLNLPVLDRQIVHIGDEGFFNLSRDFITLVCPALEKMQLTSGDTTTARKRSSSGELALTDSSESLVLDPGQTLIKKLVKFREKIIASEHLNLKKRFAAKRKRCVSFADDKGLPLEDVVVVDKVDEVTDPDNDAYSGESRNYSVTPWIMAFFQPIFDKRKMKKTLSQKGVTLETVDVEDTRLSGTIIVDRAATARKVFIRYTKDSWKTYDDVIASKVPVELDRSRAKSEAIYSFELNIPDTVLHIQFAVCLLDTRGHQWDDNSGGNYILLHHSCLEESSGSDSDITDDSTKL